MPHEAAAGRRAVDLLTGLLSSGRRQVAGALLMLSRITGLVAVVREPGDTYIDAATLRALPAVRPTEMLTAAPRDTNRSHGNGGVIAHPRAPLPVFDRPGGRAFARLTTTLAGSEVWLPVVAQQAGWIQVLLPAQPAGSTGWLDAARVTLAISRHEIRILMTERRAQLVVAGRITRTWPITRGTPDPPAPAGRTFLLAVTRNPGRHPDPIVLPLAGPSSRTGCGIDGAIAVHAGPPHAGCITVPPDALPALARAPLGSLVRIYP